MAICSWGIGLKKACTWRSSSGGQACLTDWNSIARHPLLAAKAYDMADLPPFPLSEKALEAISQIPIIEPSGWMLEKIIDMEG